MWGNFFTIHDLKKFPAKEHNKDLGRNIKKYQTSLAWPIIELELEKKTTSVIYIYQQNMLVYKVYKSDFLCKLSKVVITRNELKWG